MTLTIKDIEGIGPSYKEKLTAAGIRTSDDLLKAGRTGKGRADLSKRTGISTKLLLEWTNLSDLARIKGIGEEYSDLLEEAGVDTVSELSRRVPEKLYQKILEINEQKRLVRRAPAETSVENWVQQAKKLPRAIEY